MHGRLLGGVVAGALLTLVAAGPVWAHVGVEPEEVSAGDYEKLTVTVPTEKEIPTTEVRLEVPEGFTVYGVRTTEGWEHEFEEEGGIVTAVTWSGGEIGPQEYQEFQISAQVPDGAGEYAFDAAQTYEDGSEVRWTGAPDSEEPAPVVTVVAGGSGGHSHGGATSEAASEESHDHGSGGASGQTTGDLPQTGGSVSPLLAAAGVSFLAGLAAAALIARRRRAS